jgi:putative phosphoribosyl transferase
MKKIKDTAKVKIIAYSGEPFKDREEAGRLLAEQLGILRNKRAIVLGIPRGGIIVAKELASGINADLDIVLSRKLGTPGQPELAMGSLTEDGRVFLNEYVVKAMRVTKQEIEQEKVRQLTEIRRRTQLIRNVLPKSPLKNRIVVVTDDGVATGATMQAALWAVRQENPQRIILAIPVASDEALNKLSADAEEIVCLRQPPIFYAVGQFYGQFYQVQDEEVLQVLKAEASRRLKKRRKRRTLADHE